MESEGAVKTAWYRRTEVILVLIGVLAIGAGIFWWRTGGEKIPAIEVIDNSAGQEVDQNEELTVDVAGAVNAPGVFKLPANSRVEDAIARAGGESEEADHEWVEKNVNRADKLKDGMKIYLPKKTETQNGGSMVQGVATENKNCVSLNNASESELESLPGVGPVTAGKIVSGRPYSEVGELKDKKIVGTKVYEQIEAKVCVW